MGIARDKKELNFDVVITTSASSRRQGYNRVTFGDLLGKKTYEELQERLGDNFLKREEYEALSDAMINFILDEKGYENYNFIRVLYDTQKLADDPEKLNKRLEKIYLKFVEPIPYEEVKNVSSFEKVTSEEMIKEITDEEIDETKKSPANLTDAQIKDLADKRSKGKLELADLNDALLEILLLLQRDTMRRFLRKYCNDPEPSRSKKSGIDNANESSVVRTRAVTAFFPGIEYSTDSRMGAEPTMGSHMGKFDYDEKTEYKEDADFDILKLRKPKEKLSDKDIKTLWDNTYLVYKNYKKSYDKLSKEKQHKIADFRGSLRVLKEAIRALFSTNILTRRVCIFDRLSEDPKLIESSEMQAFRDAYKNFKHLCASEGEITGRQVAVAREMLDYAGDLAFAIDRKAMPAIGNDGVGVQNKPS